MHQSTQRALRTKHTWRHNITTITKTIPKAFELRWPLPSLISQKAPALPQKSNPRAPTATAILAPGVRRRVTTLLFVAAIREDKKKCNHAPALCRARVSRASFSPLKRPASRIDPKSFRLEIFPNACAFLGSVLALSFSSVVESPRKSRREERAASEEAKRASESASTKSRIISISRPEGGNPTYRRGRHKGIGKKHSEISHSRSCSGGMRVGEWFSSSCEVVIDVTGRSPSHLFASIIATSISRHVNCTCFGNVKNRSTGETCLGHLRRTRSTFYKCARSWVIFFSFVTSFLRQLCFPICWMCLMRWKLWNFSK